MTAKKLRKIRLDNGYTLVDVQEKSRKRGLSGISSGHVQQMETGKRPISDKILYIYGKWGWIREKGW